MIIPVWSSDPHRKSTWNLPCECLFFWKNITFHPHDPILGSCCNKATNWVHGTSGNEARWRFSSSLAQPIRTASVPAASGRGRSHKSQTIARQFQEFRFPARVGEDSGVEVTLHCQVAARTGWVATSCSRCRKRRRRHLVRIRPATGPSNRRPVSSCPRSRTLA